MAASSGVVGVVSVVNMVGVVMQLTVVLKPRQSLAQAAEVTVQGLDTHSTGPPLNWFKGQKILRHEPMGQT